MLHQFRVSKAAVEYKLYKEDMEILSSHHKYSKLEIKIYCVLYVGSGIFAADIIALGTSDDMNQTICSINNNLSKKVAAKSEGGNNIIIQKGTETILVIDYVSDEHNIIFTYSDIFFDEEKLLRLTHHYSSLIKKWAEAVDSPINDIRYISEQERIEVCAAARGIKEYYPASMNIYEIFLAQWRYNADQVAFIDFTERQLQKYTYQKIYTKVQVLSDYMLNLKLSQNSIIAVYGNRSVYTVISLFTILKLGYIYMPILPPGLSLIDLTQPNPAASRKCLSGACHRP